MNEERKRHLLRRVGKLLRQADGTPYREEAETALLLAQKVLAENGMRMEEVDALSQEEQKAAVANEELVDLGTSDSRWLRHLARLIAQNFRCKLYWKNGDYNWDKRKRARSLRLVGLSEDVAVCRDVYNSARTAGERLARQYTRDRDNILGYLRDKDYYTFKWLSWPQISTGHKAAASKVLKAAYLEGFCDGLRAKFDEQKKQNPSLALVLTVHPVVEQAFKDLNLTGPRHSLPSLGRDDAAARRAGFQAGRQFEARRPERLAPATPRLAPGH